MLCLNSLTRGHRTLGHPLQPELESVLFNSAQYLSTEISQLHPHLYVLLHLFDGGHEVIVSAVDLVVPPRPRGVRNARPEPVGVLPHQVVVESVFQRPQDDDGPRELEVDLLDGLVRQDGHCSRKVLTTPGKTTIRQN